MPWRGWSGTCGNASDGLQVGQEVEGVDLNVGAKEHINGEHASRHQVAQAQLCQVALQQNQPTTLTTAALAPLKIFLLEHDAMSFLDTIDLA